MKTRSVKANGWKPKSCLGQVFNLKMGCFLQQSAVNHRDLSVHRDSLK